MLGIKNGRQPQLDNTGPSASSTARAPNGSSCSRCAFIRGRAGMVRPLTRRVDLVPPRGAEPS